MPESYGFRHFLFLQLRSLKLLPAEGDVYKRQQRLRLLLLYRLSDLISAGEL